MKRKRSLSAPLTSTEREITGRVFDIQSYSVHDGPGCRTLIFLSGCPFRCTWCCNPECFATKDSKLYRFAKCKACGRCIKSCPYGAARPNPDRDPEKPIAFDWEKCRACKTFECIDTCYAGALERVSKIYSVEDIMYILSRDRKFWQERGGVTFSGGDPMMQSEFLLAILKRCEEVYIHCAIETEASAKTETYLEIMRYMDFAFNDLKCMDSELHKRVTGLGNEQVLANISAFAASDLKARLILRCPIIEGVNDNEENFDRVGEFMSSVGLDEFNILPFHRLGTTKWEQLGMKYAFDQCQPTPDEKMRRFQDVLQGHGIKCYVGSDTPF